MRVDPHAHGTILAHGSVETVTEAERNGGSCGQVCSSCLLRSDRVPLLQGAHGVGAAHTDLDGLDHRVEGL